MQPPLPTVTAILFTVDPLLPANLMHGADAHFSDVSFSLVGAG